MAGLSATERSRRRMAICFTTRSKVKSRLSPGQQGSHGLRHTVRGLPRAARESGKIETREGHGRTALLALTLRSRNGKALGSRTSKVGSRARLTKLRD